MSSAEDDQELHEHDNGDAVVHGMKKRRVQRACDICRRKKGMGQPSFVVGDSID